MTAYCNQLRDEVDMIHENHIKELNKYRDDLYTQIEEYETFCNRHIEKQTHSFEENEKIIQKTKRFLSNWFVKSILIAHY